MAEESSDQEPSLPFNISDILSKPSFSPSSDDIGELERELAVEQRRFTQEAQAKEKLPINARDIHEILQDHEFTRRIAACMQTQIDKPPDITREQEILAEIFDVDMDSSKPEIAFQIYRDYDSPETTYSTQEEGTSTSVSSSDVLGIHNPRQFKFFDFHSEPSHEEVLKRRPPLPSIIDPYIGLGGDLAALVYSQSNMV